MTTVSIVEDDAKLRANITEYLQGTRKFRCVSGHASAEEAIASLPDQSPQIVLMDINLGVMSGIECVRRLKPLMPKSQFVMLTVFEDTEKIFDALAAGASGYLLKRQPPAKLIEALHEVLAGGAPMSAPIARKVVASFQNHATSQSEKEQLSPREVEVLDRLAKGFPYKQIGSELGISIDTIRTYIRRIYEKLHVQSRTEAVAKYLKS
jgi:DNA-binding NarL/FixJ family response regulator